MDWWMTQFHGCQNLICTVSSLIPVAGIEHRAYTTVNLGTILSGTTVLHPRVQHDLMVYESEQPQMIDTDGCWRKEGVVLCQGKQDRIMRQQCWHKEGSCLMDAEELSQPYVKYLGQGYWGWYQMSNDALYSAYGLNCTQRGTLPQGVYCTSSPVLGIDIAGTQGRTPITPEKRLDIKPDTPIHLQKLPLGFGAELKAWLVDFGQQDEILNVLKDAEKQATIRLTHDQNKLIQVSHALEEDAKISWWESIFGYSPNASAFLDILLHPVVVLICVALLLSLMQVMMCITIRRMNAKTMRMCTSTRYLLSRKSH